MYNALPEPDTLSELESYAVSIVKEAGKILAEHQNKPTKLDFKGEHRTDPVTSADLALEAFITNSIKAKYPNHSIVGEETESDNQAYEDYIWIIDPLDGTANFASGLLLHGISIGISYKGIPIVGCIYIPNNHNDGDIFHARLGGGAFVNGISLDISNIKEINPVGLTGLPHMANRRFDFSRTKDTGLGEIRVTGSIVYEMVLVSRGIMQLALFGNPHIWDIAAGIVIVRESGGEVLQWSGSTWMPLTTILESNKADTIRKSRMPIMAGSLKLTEAISSKIRVKRNLLARLSDYISSIAGNRHRR